MPRSQIWEQAHLLFTKPNTSTEFEQYRAKQLAAPFSSLSSSVHYKSLPFHDTRIALEKG